MTRRARLVILVAVALGLAGGALSGCGLWRPTTVPMASIVDAAPCAVRPDTLLVLLPGSYSAPQEFVREGFVDALRRRRLAVDVVLVDAHRGYYVDKTIVDRLHADVIAPARARGYAQVWLVGISIGAFGAMLYSDTHPGAIDGIVALGPYLGTRQAARGIEAAGGLRAWQAPAGALGDDQVDARLWRWMQRATGDVPTAAPARQPLLYLGYGVDDRFRFDHELLAAALPPERVVTTPGGHDWVAWRVLWDRLLDRLPLPADAGCPAGNSGPATR